MVKASIIIPAYNVADYIGKTLDSILSQTFADFECIVVDDGSKDETIKVVQSYNDARLKIISIDNSGGPARPRNIGIKAATGEYIFLFDSDDVMYPNKLELSIKALEQNPTADILFTNFQSIDINETILNGNYLEEYDTLWNLIGGKTEEEKSFFIPSQAIYPALIKANFIGTSSVVLRRSSLRIEDKFFEELKNGDDYLFWVRFTSKKHAVFFNAILHQYRIRDNSISKSNYLKVGPGRIRALSLILQECTSPSLNSILNRKLANLYYAMSYEYLKRKEFHNQRDYAWKSLTKMFSVKGAKLLMQGAAMSLFTNK